MSAQTPTTVQDIYSQTGKSTLQQSNSTVVYSFGNWHAGNMDGNLSLWSALFDELLSDKSLSSVDGLVSDSDGIQLNWDNVNKEITVFSDSSKSGHTSVLIAEMNGATREVVNVEDNPAKISLADYTPGIYAVAVAVDGKLVKTLKINLK